MAKIAFVVARPETLLSLYNMGKLPDLLPSYCAQKKINFYASKVDAYASSQASIRQTFLIELVLPEESELLYISNRLFPQEGEPIAEADSFSPLWIKSIWGTCATGVKLADRLLNGEQSHKIKLDEEAPLKKTVPATSSVFFATQEKKVQGKFIKTGDLLDSGCHALVNTVNCVGVMGKGIALHFKRYYPLMYKDYRQKCQRGEVSPGEPYVYKVSDKRVIVNFPTKKHWRNRSNIEWIKKGLEKLYALVKEENLRSVALPPLGCGNGGLPWKDVLPLLESFAKKLDVPVEIYAPFVSAANTKKAGKRKQNNNTGSTHSNKRQTILAPRLTAAEATLTPSAEAQERTLGLG